MAHKIEQLTRYIVIILICAICLIPFYVLLILSLNSPSRVFYQGNIFIPSFDFTNYVEAWIRSNIGRAIFNSALITGGSLIIIVVLGAMAGYAIARFPNRWNRLVLKTMIACMLIPGIINTVPLYTLMRNLNAVDTIWGMILVCAALAIRAPVFIFTNYISALPHEIEEAAIIDGCSPFGAFWCVTFPLIKPAISAVCIINGFGIWNNYGQAVFFLQSARKHNVPQALSVFFMQFSGTQWHLISATAVIAILPVIVLFLIFQKHFMRGLADGAIKG